MKTISIDFETYSKELLAEYFKGMAEGRRRIVLALEKCARDDHKEALAILTEDFECNPAALERAIYFLGLKDFAEREHSELMPKNKLEAT